MALSFTGDFTEPKFQVGTGSFGLVLNKLVDSSRPFCSAMPTSLRHHCLFPPSKPFILLCCRQGNKTPLSVSPQLLTLQHSSLYHLGSPCRGRLFRQGVYNTGHSSLLVSSLLPITYLFWVNFLIS